MKLKTLLKYNITVRTIIFFKENDLHKMITIDYTLDIPNHVDTSNSLNVKMDTPVMLSTEFSERNVKYFMAYNDELHITLK